MYIVLRLYNVFMCVICILCVIHFFFVIIRRYRAQWNKMGSRDLMSHITSFIKGKLELLQNDTKEGTYIIYTILLINCKNGRISFLRILRVVDIYTVYVICMHYIQLFLLAHIQQVPILFLYMLRQGIKI